MVYSDVIKLSQRYFHTRFTSLHHQLTGTPTDSTVQLPENITATVNSSTVSVAASAVGSSVPSVAGSVIGVVSKPLIPVDKPAQVLIPPQIPPQDLASLVGCVILTSF